MLALERSPLDGPALCDRDAGYLLEAGVEGATAVYSVRGMSAAIRNRSGVSLAIFSSVTLDDHVFVQSMPQHSPS